MVIFLNGDQIIIAFVPKATITHLLLDYYSQNTTLVEEAYVLIKCYSYRLTVS